MQNIHKLVFLASEQPGYTIVIHSECVYIHGNYLLTLPPLSCVATGCMGMSGRACLCLLLHLGLLLVCLDS